MGHFFSSRSWIDVDGGGGGRLLLIEVSRSAGLVGRYHNE